jgi:hypothetical protein
MESVGGTPPALDGVAHGVTHAWHAIISEVTHAGQAWRTADTLIEQRQWPGQQLAGRRRAFAAPASADVSAYDLRVPM